MYVAGAVFSSSEYTNPESGFWSPLRLNDPSQDLKVFEVWVSTYFPPLKELPTFDPADHDTTHDIMHNRKSLDKPPTCTRLSADITYDGYWHISRSLKQIKPEVSRENVLRALTRLEDSTDKQKWGLHFKFKVILIWCDQSFADCILGVSAIAHYHKELKKTGAQVRPIEVLKIENANHFVSMVYFHKNLS